MISNPVGREPGNSLMKLEIDPEHVVATAGGTQITKLGQVSSDPRPSLLASSFRFNQ